MGGAGIAAAGEAVPLWPVWLCHSLTRDVERDGDRTAVRAKHAAPGGAGARRARVCDHVCDRPRRGRNQSENRFYLTFSGTNLGAA